MAKRYPVPLSSWTATRACPGSGGAPGRATDPPTSEVAWLGDGSKGIHTIVDPTVWGLGRYIPRIQRIAAATPVNIIVATGLYVYEELP